MLGIVCVVSTAVDGRSRYCVSLACLLYTVGMRLKFGCVRDPAWPLTELPLHSKYAHVENVSNILFPPLPYNTHMT